MSAIYNWWMTPEGREAVDVDSDGAYGVLTAGPSGFPAEDWQSKKYWSPEAWLKWAGEGATWEQGGKRAV